MKKEKTLKEIEEEMFDSDDSNEFPPTDIVSYNELRSCADLFRLYEDNTLELHPVYQRKEVWGDSEQTRFIDSLVKGMPIPSLCVSLDFETQKWEVIDGLQRMTAIIKFLNRNDDWKLSSLNDISQEISGKNASDIRKNNPNIYRRIENTSLPINILRCSYAEDSHIEYIFTIFSRLNTTAVKLSNQEIRNSMFSGSFNELLFSLEKNEEWQKIYRTPAKKNRLSSTEMVLRFFAFHDWKGKYDGKLSRFLNLYMKNKRKIDNNEKQKYEALFIRTIKIASLFSKEMTSKALTDAVLYGISKNISEIETKEQKAIHSYFARLMNSTEFKESSLRDGTAQKTKVISRLDRAKEIFSGK